MSRSIYEFGRSSMSIIDLIEHIKRNLDDNGCVYWEEVYGFDDGGECSTWNLVRFNLDDNELEKFRQENADEINKSYSMLYGVFMDKFSEVVEKNINRTKINIAILREAEEKAKKSN